MGEGILVFASKQVGRELVEYLVELGAPVRRVIAANDGDREILNPAIARRIPTEVYSKQTQQQLEENGHKYQWLLNLWSPHILGPGVLALAEHRLNTHPSLVPICQGNDTAAWVIRKGLSAGVSLLEMHVTVDSGEVYVQKEVPYSFPVRGSELHALLQRELVALFKDSWPAIYSGSTSPRPQNGPATYHTRKQTEQDRVLDPSVKMTLGEFLAWACAHDFYPGTTAEVSYRGSNYRLTLNVEKK